MCIYSKNCPPVNFYTYAYLRGDNTPYYIGKGKGKRAWIKSKNEIKPPKDLSRVIIIESNLSEIGALALERRYIKWYGRKDLGSGILRNKTDGGDGSCNHKRKPISDETRKKLSSSGKLRKHSEETKAKMSAASRDKPKSDAQIEKMKLLRHSDEAKAKMSAANKGRTMSDETKAKMSSASKGKAKSITHAENISKGLTGIKRQSWSDEEKLKRSIANKGKASLSKGAKGRYKHSEEAKRKIAESNSKRIVSAETKAKIAASLAKTRALKKL